jgi:hypothetical protein
LDDKPSGEPHSLKKADLDEIVGEERKDQTAADDEEAPGERDVGENAGGQRRMGAL